MTSLVLVIVVVGLLLVIGAAQRRSRRVRAVSANLLISYTVIVGMFVLGEIYFRFFFAESDGIPTLALDNWLDRHWQTNSLGYRDREWMAADWQDETTVLIVGDSFTAGWGIDDPRDRFGDVLADQLGADYTVINLGEPGASTVETLANLEAHPLQTPDHVIIQYTLNDIENAALSIGLDPGLDPLADLPAWAQESYLGNFIYWRLSALTGRRASAQPYIDWLHAMYDHSVVWAIHEEQIHALIDAVEARGADLGVVIFPDMHDPVGSIAYVDRVAQVFELRGYGDRVLKLFDLAAAMPPEARMVSPRDAHASAEFHARVGVLLYDLLFAQAITWR
ncbi:MAG: hypothetical protein GYB67_08005 [Chloroflexi bacterium]|nr:hypothetical protein [Chloroflexota bacterium]